MNRLMRRIMHTAWAEWRYDAVLENSTAQPAVTPRKP